MLKLWQLYPPSHTSPGLTGQWKTWNSRTTDYHTAPSLASRCRLMASWKVKTEKWFSLHVSLSPIFSLHHSAGTDRCHCLTHFLPLCHTSETVQKAENKAVKRRYSRRTGVMKIIKTAWSVVFLKSRKSSCKVKSVLNFFITFMSLSYNITLICDYLAKQVNEFWLPTSWASYT